MQAVEALKPLVASEVSQQIGGQTRTILCDGNGRLEVVAAAGSSMQVLGVLGDLTTLEPMLAIRFRPQAATGQAVGYAGVGVLSAPLTVNKAHWLWATTDCWIRIGAAGVVLDFPLPQRTAVEYIPTALGVDDTIGVIQIAAAGILYIGQSEA